MALKRAQVQFLQRCAKSPSFFIDQLAYIQHPTFGKMRFRLFDYQTMALRDFLTHRFNIFHKVRQSGISTLCGAFALWRAMFYKNKTILIVSKRDEDAMDFLRKNVRYVYEELPSWMKDMWPLDRMGGSANEHRIVLPNGSRITSLTSSPNTLRSQASSLNIIDEAAFMPKMDEMWAGGWPTIQTGGNVIVISTPNGIGNWYWRTVRGAEDSTNDFNMIKINWYDMTWELEGFDPASDRRIKVAPTKDIIECETKEDKKRFGKYKSPWLEMQYRGMVAQGEERFFRQEYLCDFLGTGNTVLSMEQLEYIEATVSDKYKVVSEVNYVNPVTKEADILDFEERLWVWDQPVTGLDEDGEPIMEMKLQQDGTEKMTPMRPHIYVVGVDVSSGESSDFSAIVVWDITDQKQVAELRIRTYPKTLAKMADYIGRWYNNALVVVERNSMGVVVAQELNEDLSYPTLYREVKQNRKLKKTMGLIGFTTTMSSKPQLNGALINNLGEEGYEIRSRRFKHEADIYVHLTRTKTGAEDGIGNTDDVVLAGALGLVGVPQAIKMANSLLIPVHADGFAPDLKDRSNKSWDEHHKDITGKYSENAGRGFLAPLAVTSEEESAQASQKQAIDQFILQIGSSGMSKEAAQEHFKRQAPSTTKRKHTL